LLFDLPIHSLLCCRASLIHWRAPREGELPAALDLRAGIDQQGRSIPVWHLPVALVAT
jgi:hypothetical protein